MIVFVTLMAASCSDDMGYETRQFSATQDGPWVIPADVEAAGDQQSVTYTGGGPWNNGAACTGGPTAGAVILEDWLEDHWPQIDRIGGYRCTPVQGTLSIHGTGRALDVMIPTIGDEADNTAGDELANWLIENAEHIGIQRIIWDRWNWHTGRNPRSAPYNGEHPHHDHLHVELSVTASNEQTAFFQGPMGPPDRGPCGAPLPPSGGRIDNSDACFQSYGPDQYWREVNGSGIEGEYLWTNAFEADAPSNWARWQIDLAEAGLYKVEIFAHADHAVFDQIRYDVRHDGNTVEVILDQSNGEDWRSMGNFQFASGRDQWVSVYDNYAFGVADDQHIAVDAIRLTRVDTSPQPDAGTMEDTGPSPDGGSQPDARVDGGEDAREPTPTPDSGSDTDAVEADTGSGATYEDDAGARRTFGGSACNTTPGSPLGLLSMLLVLAGWACARAVFCPALRRHLPARISLGTKHCSTNSR